MESGEYFKVNAYMFNSEILNGKVVVISTRCNGDAMRYQDKSENTQGEIDETHKPVSTPP